jgi:hypothetical protein
MSAWRQCVLATMVLSLPAVACLGQEKKKPEPKSVDIQVWAIRATTKNKEISKELRQIADELKKQFKFTGFKLEAQSTGSAAIGEAYKVNLPGGYEAKITPENKERKHVKLRVEVSKDRKQVLKTTYTLEAGKFQLQGGWDLDGGDSLILAVSAK